MNIELLKIIFYFFLGLFAFFLIAVLWRIILVKVVGKYWGRYVKGGFAVGYMPDDVKNENQSKKD